MVAKSSGGYLPPYGRSRERFSAAMSSHGEHEIGTLRLRAPAGAFCLRDTKDRV